MQHKNTERAPLPFTFSLGDRSSYPGRNGEPVPDNRPVPCASQDFDDFFEVFNQTRAPEKCRQYIVALMEGDDRVKVGRKTVARRCQVNVQPRRWIAFDLDAKVRADKDKGIRRVPLTDEMFSDIIDVAERIGEGLYYETSSSKVDDRRARFVFSLDVALPHGSIIAVSKYIESLMPRADWDQTVYRGEQPLYMPPESVNVVRFAGEPIDVAAITRRVIAYAPKPRVFTPRVMSPLERQRAGETLGCLRQLGLHVAARANGMHDIICPWGHLHSDGRLEAAYYEPCASNGGVGGFKCMHSHCEDRNIGDLLKFIDECAGVRHAA